MCLRQTGRQQQTYSECTCVCVSICRQRYITTSREIKRWDATSRSPVYASFSATLKVSAQPTLKNWAPNIWCLIVTC